MKKLESRIERLEDQSGLRGRVFVAFTNGEETDEQAEARAAAEYDIGPTDLLVIIRRFSSELARDNLVLQSHHID